MSAHIASCETGVESAASGAHQELIEVLTAIAYYADACGEVAKKHGQPACEQIVDWSDRICKQVMRGDSLVKSLMEPSGGK